MAKYSIDAGRLNPGDEVAYYSNRKGEQPTIRKIKSISKDYDVVLEPDPKGGGYTKFRRNGELDNRGPGGQMLPLPHIQYVTGGLREHLAMLSVLNQPFLRISTKELKPYRPVVVNSGHLYCNKEVALVQKVTSKGTVVLRDGRKFNSDGKLTPDAGPSGKDFPYFAYLSECTDEVREALRRKQIIDSIKNAKFENFSTEYLEDIFDRLDIYFE